MTRPCNHIIFQLTHLSCKLLPIKVAALNLEKQGKALVMKIGFDSECLFQLA